MSDLPYHSEQTYHSSTLQPQPGPNVKTENGVVDWILSHYHNYRDAEHQWGESIRVLDSSIEKNSFEDINLNHEVRNNC